MKLKNLAVLAALAAGAEEAPKALGVTQGQAISDDTAVVHQDGPLKTAILPSVAGFDRVFVLFTDSQGACKVSGYELVDNARGDSYGIRHRQVADKWITRMQAKLGRTPSQRTDEHWDSVFDDAKHWLMALERGNAAYDAYWVNGDAMPFRATAVQTQSGRISVSFEFANVEACFAERDAANQAEF